MQNVKLRTLLLSLGVLPGCVFTSPPVVEDGSSDSGEASSTAGATTGEASTSSDGASSSASTDVLDTSTSEGSSDDRGSDDSSSTGEPMCGCTGGELLCESFEPPFELGVLPW